MCSIEALASQQFRCMPKKQTLREEWKESIEWFFRRRKHEWEEKVKAFERVATDERVPYGIVLQAQKDLEGAKESYKRATKFHQWAYDIDISEGTVVKVVGGKPHIDWNQCTYETEEIRELIQNIFATNKIFNLPRHLTFEVVESQNGDRVAKIKKRNEEDYN